MPACAIWSSAGCRLAAAKMVGGAAFTAVGANMQTAANTPLQNRPIRRIAYAAVVVGVIPAAAFREAGSMRYGFNGPR
jgi:hypothetical protein